MGNAAKTILVVFLVFVVVFGVSLVSVLGWGYGVVRREQQLRNQFVAQLDINRVNYDTMWKIIQQKAGVAEEYKESFQEIYPELISGRYKQGGTLAKFVTESNPNFDPALLQQVSNAIEEHRVGFKLAQDQLIDIRLQHTNLVTVPMSSFVCALLGKEEIPASEMKLITSTKTEKTFESGKEDDVKLFDRDN